LKGTTEPVLRDVNFGAVTLQEHFSFLDDVKSQLAGDAFFLNLAGVYINLFTFRDGLLWRGSKLYVPMGPL
jgi:hypothetical protein